MGKILDLPKAAVSVLSRLNFKLYCYAYRVITADQSERRILVLALELHVVLQFFFDACQIVW